MAMYAVEWKQQLMMVKRSLVTILDETAGRLSLSLLHNEKDVLKDFIAYCQRAERDLGLTGKGNA